MTTKSIAKDLISFIEKSPTPFHATLNLLDLFKAKRFTVLDEGDDWQIKAGKSYVVTRNDSSIIAFRTGAKLDAGINICLLYTSPSPRDS